MDNSDLDKLDKLLSSSREGLHYESDESYLDKLMVEAERELYYKNILLRKWAIIDIFIGQNKKKEVIVRMNRYCFPLQLPGDEKEK